MELHAVLQRANGRFLGCTLNDSHLLRVRRARVLRDWCWVDQPGAVREGQPLAPVSPVAAANKADQILEHPYRRLFRSDPDEGDRKCATSRL